MKNIFKKPGVKIINIILALVLVISSFATVFADFEIIQSDPYKPEGTQNLALNKTVSASSTYNAPTWDSGWHQNFLVDGKIGTETNWPYGWTTHPDDGSNSATPAWAVIDLGAPYELKRIVLHPRQDTGNVGSGYPVDYSFDFSADGINYSNSIHVTGKQNVGNHAQISDITSAVTARYVRLNVTRRSGNVVQLSEIAVYGISAGSLNLTKNRILLESGDSRTLKYMLESLSEENVNLSWHSNAPSVAEVNASGTVTAKAQGTAVITLTDSLSGLTSSCEVIVEDELYDPKAGILISAFWPPMPEQYVNETQYDYLKEAHINYVQNVKTSELTTKSINLEMARLAYERGIQIGVSDARFGGYLNMTDEEVIAMAEEYADIPGVGGMYICDEPYNANPYSRIQRLIKETAPNFYPYLNFLPSNSYVTEKRYRAQMQDFLKLSGPKNVEYLMYDRYPFGRQAGTLDYTGMLKNMESVWQVGLQNDVKTGLYIQSVGTGGSGWYRRPGENEIRYEVFSALAYGFKQLSYFTWFSPVNRNEIFTDAIITSKGEKTDLYEPVKKLNGEVMNWSDTLIRLDAQGVYFSGANTYGMETVPEIFFAQPGDNKNMMYSYMRDKHNGRNYLMVVNTDFLSGVSTSLKLDKSITSLGEILKSDGSISPVTINNGSIALTFTPGEGRLFVLPENFDYGVKLTQQEDNVNLAKNADVSAPSSIGTEDYYIRFLTDGQRFSANESNGWKSESYESLDNHIPVVIDLGNNLTFNGLDLYPTGKAEDYAVFFPRAFTIDVSNDKKEWKTVKTVNDFERPMYNVPVFNFDAVNARYIRINITELPYFIGAYTAALSEIEVYNDTGETPVPPVPPSVTNPSAYTPGDNIALNKPIATSSSYEANEWGWATRFLNDGQKGPTGSTNGWTSAVGRNMESPNATEWIAIFLGDTYSINKINLYPRADGQDAGKGFPTDYHIDVSTDGINWTTVATKTGDTQQTSTVRTFVLSQPTNASFIRVTGTKLKMGGNARDGYLMQLNEIEAFGDPVCDKTELLSVLVLANQYEQSTYTQNSWNALKVSREAANEVKDNRYATQGQANKAIFDLRNSMANLVEGPNRAALTLAINNASQLKENEYTSSSWVNLQQALSTVQTVLNNPNALKSEGEEALAVLTHAINSLVKTGESEPWDTSALEELYHICLNLIEEDYTLSSWEKLEKAMTEAKLVIENPLSPEDIRNAYNELLSAKLGLEKRPDTSELEIYIEEANEILKKPSNIRPGKLNILKTALAAAKDAILSSNISQEEIDELARELLTAIVNLKDIVDKSDVNHLIDIAEGLNSSQYNPLTWEALEGALNSARLLNDDSEKSEVTQIYNTLQTALINLEKLPSKDALKNALDKAEYIIDNESLFIASTIKSLKESYNSAKSVYDNPASTADKINSAAKAMAKANAAARVKEDKTALFNAVNQAKALDSAKYDTQSFDLLNARLAEALLVLEDEEATKIQVENAVKLLGSAMDDLVQVNLKAHVPATGDSFTPIILLAAASFIAGIIFILFKNNSKRA